MTSSFVRVSLSLILLVALFRLISSQEDSHLYRKKAIIEWSPSDVESFFIEEFPGSQMKGLGEISGSDLISLDDADLEELDVKSDDERRVILNRIRSFVEKDHSPNSFALEELYLDSDDLPDHLRRFDLDKVRLLDPRTFFFYFQLWSASPTVGFFYMYNKDPQLLRRILHLPTDYTFTATDFIGFSLFARFLVIKKVLDMNYKESNPYISWTIIIAQSCFALSFFASLIVNRSYNPLSLVGPVVMGSISLWYFCPNFGLRWVTIGGTVLVQGLIAVPQVFLNKKLAQLQAATRELQAKAKKDQEAKKDRNATEAVQISSTESPVELD